ncbi:hypothetical protein OC842_007294, partial [Tilletia horrida]
YAKPGPNTGCYTCALPIDFCKSMALDMAESGEGGSAFMQREGQALSVRCCQAVARGSGGAGVNPAVKLFICALMRFPDLFTRSYARVQEVLPGFRLPEPNLNSVRPPREWLEEAKDMRLEGFKVYKSLWLVIALLGLL